MKPPSDKNRRFILNALQILWVVLGGFVICELAVIGFLAWLFASIQ